MAHFTKTRAIWNPLTLLLAAELASLDLKTFKAINGDDGGTWAPASVITVGGAGMTVALVGTNSLASTASMNMDGLFRVRTGASVDFQSGSNYSLDAGASAFINGSTTYGVGSSLQFNGAGLNFNADSEVAFFGSFIGAVGSYVELGGVLSVGGEAIFNGPMTISGATLTVQAGATFQNDVAFTGTDPILVGPPLKLFQGGTNYGPLKGSGAGRVVKRTSVIASTSSNITTYGPQNCDRLVVNGLSANVSMTIDTTNAVDGDEFLIVNNSTTSNITLTNPSGLRLQNINSPAVYRSCLLTYSGGSWIALTRETVNV